MRETILGILLFLLFCASVHGQHQHKTGYSMTESHTTNKKIRKAGPRVLRPAKNRRPIDVKQDSIKKHRLAIESFLYEFTYIGQGYAQIDKLNKGKKASTEVSEDDFRSNYTIVNPELWDMRFAQSCGVPYDHNELRIMAAKNILEYDLEKYDFQEYEVYFERYRDLVDFTAILVYENTIIVEGKKKKVLLFFENKSTPLIHYIDRMTTYSNGSKRLDTEIVATIYSKPEGYDSFVEEINKEQFDAKIALVEDSLVVDYNTISLSDGQQHDNDVIKIVSSAGERTYNLAEESVDLTSYNEDIIIEASSEGTVPPCTLEFTENNEIHSRVNLKKGEQIVLKKKNRFFYIKKKTEVTYRYSISICLYCS